MFYCPPYKSAMRWQNICNLWSTQTACQLSSCASAQPKYSQEILADFSEDSNSSNEVPESLQNGHKANFCQVTNRQCF